MPNTEGKGKQEKMRKERGRERDGMGFCRHCHTHPSLSESQDHP